MKLTAKILTVLVLGLLTSCYNTRSITKSETLSPELILAGVKPNRTYEVKVNTGMEYRVHVVAIDKDSLSGTFYFKAGTKAYKMKDAIALQNITDVKEVKFSPVQTVGAITLGGALTVLILYRMLLDYPFSFY